MAATPYTMDAMFPGKLTKGFATFVVMTVCGASAGHAQETWRPDKNVEIIVPTAPGGGNDKTARTLQKIWQEIGFQTTVQNRTGGGGAVAYSYLSQRQGDAHYVAIAQAGLFTNHITGKSPIHYTDFTVLANLGTEPSAIAVRLDSPIKSGRELFDRLKQDATAYSISIGSTMGGTSHMALSRAYKVMGGDPKKLKAVAFAGTAEAVPQVLGGHIDALISAINNVVPHVKAGKMRAIAVTSSQRLTGEFASVPTLRELGADVVQTGWTIVMAPKGVTPAQVRYWEDMIAKAAQTPEWKAYLAENYWTYTFQRSGDTVRYLGTEYENARRALVDLGMAKTSNP
jgi:putative tricarboxylic transport membrane protein